MNLGIALADFILDSGSPPLMKTYTVQRGDTLSSIAAKFLGNPSRWREIWNLNSQIANPDKIEVGDVLTLPAQAVAVSSDPNKTLPGPRQTALPAPVSSDSSESLLSSPYILVAGAGVALLLILALTKKTA